LQSLFDEFEQLRAKKQEVTFGLIGGLAVCSLYFCTNVSYWLVNKNPLRKQPLVFFTAWCSLFCDSIDRYYFLTNTAAFAASFGGFVGLWTRSIPEGY